MTRLDRTVLLADLGSGALWLLLLALLGAWPLALIGAVYVVAASVFLAAAHARSSLTRTQGAVAWAIPWLATSALWAGLLSDIDGPGPAAVVVGLGIGTASFVAWQLSALAVRQLLAWRSGLPVGHG